MNKLNFCSTPFTNVELHYNGDISLCCPSYLNECFVGNIFENSFDEIWNGEKAIKFRKEILNGTYANCKLGECRYKKQNNETINNISPYVKNYPLTVFFCHDRQCNVRCIMCRDEHICTNKEKEKFLDSLIDTRFLPMLKDARIVSFNGGGEFFASQHMMNLAKAIAEKYPQIALRIFSNGISYNKENCDKLGITDRIKVAEISIHAATKETYDKIVLGGNFDKVIENITWLSELKKQKKLYQLTIDFVISSYNYFEMPKFQKIANDLDCIAFFTTYRPWNSKMAEDYEEVAIFNKTHPKHKDFLKILKNPIFDSPNCSLQNSLIEMRNDALKPFWKKIF